MSRSSASSLTLERPGPTFAERTRHALTRIDILFSLVATLVVLGLMAAFGVKPGVPLDALGEPFQILGLFLLIVAAVRLPALIQGVRKRRYARWLLQAAVDFAPFVWLYIVYRSLRRMTDVLSLRSVEPELVAIGRALFGEEPTFWIQRFASPWLTEYMAFAYALMFVFPVVVLVLLHLAERRDLFREVVIAILAAFFLGFVGYIFVPAESPRLVYDYGGVELHGAFGLYAVLEKTWDTLSMTTYDAFPSLHTAISTLSLLYAWLLGPVVWPRRPRTLGWIFLPFVVSLWISTLYLRQHYVIDVVAGLVMATAVVAGCRRVLPGRTGARPAGHRLESKL